MMLPENIKDKLRNTVYKMLADNKGLLATDEKASSLGKKFEKYDIENTIEKRRDFRLLLYSCEHLEHFIGGVILNEETFTQKDESGKLLYEYLNENGIEIGIKVDKGTVDIRSEQTPNDCAKPMEKLTVGIEDLDHRLQDPRFKIATFAKWRALFFIKEEEPTDQCIGENIKILCKFAEITQRNGMVPILEPEICIEGTYTLGKMKNIAKKIYSSLIKGLDNNGIYLPGTLLKLSFLTPGDDSRELFSADDIGCENIELLSQSIPSSVGGIVFLSGGHSSEEAIEYLNSIKKCNNLIQSKISFSFARAITNDVMKAWGGKDENCIKAHKYLVETLFSCYKANSLGSMIS